MKPTHIAISALAATLTLSFAASNGSADAAPRECNWMEDWWFESEGGGGDLFYHAGYDLGKSGIEGEIPTGPGQWKASGLDSRENYHKNAENGFLSNPPHPGC